MIAIQRLPENHISLAAHTLAAAFMKDPLQQYVFPEEEERRLKSPPHFEGVIRYGHLFGEVYSTSGTEGVAVWLPPGATEVTPERAEESGLGALPAILGEEAAGRFFGVMEYLEPFHGIDAAEPHWYTMVIGVDPASCGKGYGKALMQTVMNKAKGIPIYLETAQPANVAFYKGLGFDLVRELTEPVSGLPLWTFRKSA